MKNRRLQLGEGDADINRSNMETWQYCAQFTGKAETGLYAKCSDVT
jgi:hypothetical protein